MFPSFKIFSLAFCSFAALAHAEDKETTIWDESEAPAKGTMLFQSGQSLQPPVPGLQPGSFDNFADLSDQFERDLLQEDVSAAAAKVLVVESPEDIDEILIGRAPAKNDVQTARSSIYLSYSTFSSLFQDVFFVIFGIIGYYLWRGCAVPDFYRLSSRRRPSCSAAGAADLARVINLDTDEIVQAMYTDNKEKLQKLREERSTDAAEDVWGCTSLHVAAHCDCAPAAQALLERGAIIDMKDTWDETALHFAARSGSVQVCELLLAYGADVNPMNARDWTPLLVAAHAGNEEVCKLLLSRGAGTGGLSDADLPPLLSALLMQNVFDVPEQAESATKLKHA